MFFNSAGEDKPKERIKNTIRKISDVKGKPYYFEMGNTTDFGEVSAIVFREDVLLRSGKLYHEVYITNKKGEQKKWKGVYEDRVIEFDLS